MILHRHPRPLADQLVDRHGIPRAGGDLPDWVTRRLERGARRRAPAVARNLRAIVRTLPSAEDGAEVVAVLEKRYLRVTGVAGAATGLVAVLPGTASRLGALALSAADTAVLFAASAFFVQSRLTLQGLQAPGATPEDRRRAHALTLALLLGAEGSDALRQLGGEIAQDGPDRAAYHGSAISNATRSAALWLPSLTRAATRSDGAGRHRVFSATLHFGAAAALGATGGRAVARQIVSAADSALDPSPTVPDWLRRPARVATEPGTTAGA